jgi:hypothetical protein
MTDLRIWGPTSASHFVAFTLLCGSATVCTAFGAPINVFNTGEGPGGTALPIGQLDPNYNLISAPPGTPLTAITTSPNELWTPNTATADWISPYSSGNITAPVGNYDYQTTFTLAGLDSSTAELSGSWTSDNDGCIYLNGVNTGFCTARFGSFESFVPFSITSGFQPGVNTLDFIVTNEPGNGLNPTGVIVEISGTASPLSSVPESSSVLLTGATLLGLSSVLRRKLLNRSNEKPAVI